MNHQNPRPNILLTGIPRSGTSMLCVMLNEVPGVLALNEGLRLGEQQTGNEVRAYLEKVYEEIREQVLHDGTAPARNHAGVQVTNHFERKSGPRSLLLEKSDIRITKPLQPDFMLGVKHNATFTLVLEALLDLGWPVFAVIRNPLAVLGSWNSLDIPVSRGKVRRMDTLAPDLAKMVNEEPDLLQKQILMLDHYYRQYHAFVPPENILKYEDICKRPAEELRKIVGDRDVSAVLPTENLNASSIYPVDRFPAFETALCEMPNATWRLFYHEDELRTLREEVKKA